MEHPYDLLKLLSANSSEKIRAPCFSFIQRRNWAQSKLLVTFESPFNISCQHRDPFPSIVPKALMVSPSAFFVWDPLSGINNCRATTTTLVSPTPPASAGQLRNIFRPKTKWSAEECLKENDEEISEKGTNIFDSRAATSLGRKTTNFVCRNKQMTDSPGTKRSDSTVSTKTIASRCSHRYSLPRWR